MSKPKWQKSLPIRSLVEFSVLAECRETIFFQHKVTTYGWYQNWSLHLIQFYLQRGVLFRAIPAQVKP
jgi:hypothetical protein